MIVDDVTENVAMLASLLNQRGYNTIPAYNGFQALKKAHVDRPDLILLDVMMPRMDGFEVCRSLKTEPKTAPIPVIMVASIHDQTSISRCIEVGADDYITKPLDPVATIAAVRRLL